MENCVDMTSAKDIAPSILECGLFVAKALVEIPRRVLFRVLWIRGLCFRHVQGHHDLIEGAALLWGDSRHGHVD